MGRLGRTRTLGAAIILASCLFGVDAWALGGGHLERGEIHLGLDTSLIFSLTEDAGATSFGANVGLGGVVRVVIARDFSIAFRAGWMFRAGGAIRDNGGLGLVWFQYFAPLGYSAYFVPGLAIGGFLAQRVVDGMGGPVSRSAVGGGAVAAESPLYFPLGPRVAVHAGPEFVFMFGSTLGQRTLALVGGYKIGIVFAL